MKGFKDFLNESSSMDAAMDLEAELIKLKVDVNQLEDNTLMLNDYTIAVESSGGSIKVIVSDFDGKKIKSFSGSVKAVAKQIKTLV